MDLMNEQVQMQYPQGGDAVVTTEGCWPWGLLPAGKIGIIGGRVGEEITDGCSITFNYSAFRGRSSKYAPASDPIYVQVSGGPGTILTPVSQLEPTGEKVSVWFWRWQDIARAHGGEQYRLDVPLWRWKSGDEQAAGKEGGVAVE
jgi:hypothetical protein